MTLRGAADDDWPGMYVLAAASFTDFAEGKTSSREGDESFAFLHPDGYALYRVGGTDPKVARVGELKAVTSNAHIGLWRSATLEARTYHADLSTMLGISDGGRFALGVRDGRAHCTPTDATAEIEMDIDRLGSLYLGVHRASTLATANRLRAKDSRLVRRLDAAFVSDVAAETGYEF